MKKKIRSALLSVMAVLLLRASVPTALAASPAADFSASKYSDLIDIVARQYIARDTDFTVKYSASLSEVKSILRQGGPIWNDIYSADIPGTTSDLDYLHNNMSEMRISWQYSGSFAVCEFTQSYLTTASQEKYVNSSVGAILSGLDIDGDTVYGKIKAIHDYIINNVDYDSSCTRFTAYDALYAHSAVCQGYTLLMYKMLTEAGVPARIIGGEAVSGGTRGPHAWNIVKIGKYWYNLDVTWDDSSDTTKYLLKSNVGFPDHYRDSDYNTAAFNAAYPMSPDNFDLAQDVKLVSSISLPADQGSVYAVGDVFRLSPVIVPADATNKSLSWSTSDPKVAAVDSAGNVTVTGPGTAVITVAANDGTGKSAVFTVKAQQPVTPSAWAQDGINALNARGVVPAALAAHYRNNISRAEFMALIANVYAYFKGPVSPPSAAPFTDISSSPYADAIAICYKLGIVEGIGGNQFGPDGTLTREQCAKIIANVVAAITGSGTGSAAALPFKDAASISAWALSSVRFVFENGLMQGSGGSFNPQSVLTREQAMLLAERMIEAYK